MELAVSFVLTLGLFGLLFWVFQRGRSPVYRPSRRRVIALLRGVQEGRTSQQAWDLFIGLPIHHDPLLEKARRRCIVLSEGDSQRPPCPAGLGDYLFNRAGREEVGEILRELQEAIAKEPISRRF